MKISKLFHWLYASLMLAPVFAVGVTCLTHVFNEKVESPNYEEKVVYDYETNEVNNLSDLKNGNIYAIDFYQFETNIENNLWLEIDYSQKIYLLSKNDNEFYLDTFANISEFDLVNNDNKINYEVYSSIYGFDVSNIYSNLYTEPNFIKLLFVYDSDNFSTYAEPINFINIIEPVSEQYIINYFSHKEVIESTNPNTNIFYYAVDRLKESPYFNWAYNSFLFGPFGSITNIFSLPQNNIVSMLLSYWLALSVIWLVFDLIMYIPLLVHKWIDKAMIE